MRTRKFSVALTALFAHWTPILYVLPRCQGFGLFVPVHRNSGKSFRRPMMNTDSPGGGSNTDEKSAPLKKQPRKNALYSSTELMSLWNLHSALANTTFPTSSPPADAATLDSPPLSLHDLVKIETNALSATNQKRPPSSTCLSAKLSRARLIASDVDGTLLTTDHGLHPRTREALHGALEAASDPRHPLRYLCLATGKTREGALSSLRRADPSLSEPLSRSPGVFVQGLYCVDAGGRVVWERRLDRDTVLAVEREAARRWTNVTLLAYRGDDIFASGFSRRHHVLELHERYGEPLPQIIGSLEDLEPDQGPGMVHKLLLMHDEPERLTRVIRPALQALADRFGCEVTQAIPTMLELLPPKCSKAEGVRQLCRVLQVDADELVAIGDAENDVGLLDMAAVGFAVGNAVPAARAIADFVLDESNDDGGAGAAIERVLEHLV